MRHASFFSGVGGLDIGFERAGIETVSVCEISPYASSVLAERFPSAPNLGSITEVRAHDIPDADIWSGGFPCQDLSIAGKRAGFAGKRSSLAFTFLDLVEQRRPKWIVLENVPGLLNSNDGRDFARLQREVDELGYGMAWRVLDARFFGIPQRRRRVFLVASLGSIRAAEVLFDGEGGEGNHRAGDTPGARLADRPTHGANGDSGGGDARGAGTPIDADRMRAVDGMARRLDDQPYMGGSLTGGGSDSPQSERIFAASGQAPTLDTGRAVPTVFRKATRVSLPGTPETWVSDGLANTINTFDVGDIRTTHAILAAPGDADAGADPQHLDGHRYRCCGNGVAAPVAEWIGRRIVAEEGRL